jgi:hypothetical protein
MRPEFLKGIVLLSACLVTIHAQTPVERTMGGQPPSAAPVNEQPDSVESALRQYRSMWQKMSPAQQKAFLDSGGATPEQYEHSLRSKGAATPASGRAPQGDPRATVNALDSLTTSLQDLNAIRDGNLVRVQTDGCPREIASRLTDLRGRLQQDRSELAGRDAPAGAGARPKDASASASADPMSVANNWFKQPPAEKSSARPAEPPADSRESKLLADVLAGQPAASPAKPLDPKLPVSQQREKELREEITRLEAEIAQLSTACTTPDK